MSLEELELRIKAAIQELQICLLMLQQHQVTAPILQDVVTAHPMPHEPTFMDYLAGIGDVP